MPLAAGRGRPDRLCRFQIGSGAYLFWKRKGQRVGFLERAQAWSGLYLLFFLLNHVGSVFYGRLTAGLDTNIYFGIAGFHVSPWPWFFVPYYFFAVLALFVHLACAFNWLCRHLVANPLRQQLAFSVELGFADKWTDVFSEKEAEQTLRSIRLTACPEQLDGRASEQKFHALTDEISARVGPATIRNDTLRLWVTRMARIELTYAFHQEEDDTSAVFNLRLTRPLFDPFAEDQSLDAQVREYAR